MTEAGDDDLVPVSVRLGEVVPPEDPEDWTRPLTWAAALGMLAGPLAALAWFALAPPVSAAWNATTVAVAVTLAVGAAGAGATQQDRPRAFAGTIAAALFAALVTIILGAAFAGQRQVGVASPSVAQAFAAGAGGLAGALPASVVAPLVATRAGRGRRWLIAGVPAACVAALAVPLIAG